MTCQKQTAYHHSLVPLKTKSPHGLKQTSVHDIPAHVDRLAVDSGVGGSVRRFLCRLSPYRQEQLSLS